MLTKKQRMELRDKNRQIQLEQKLQTFKNGTFVLDKKTARRAAQIVIRELTFHNVKFHLVGCNPIYIHTRLVSVTIGDKSAMKSIHITQMNQVLPAIQKILQIHKK